jgi:RimJ/RimL family protein N-acetyltransferase
VDVDPESVTLRAVDEDDLALLQRWRNDLEHETEFGDFLFTHRHTSPIQERWSLNGMMSDEEGTLLICLDGVPVGKIAWHPVVYGPNRGSNALNLGISIEPQARGRGVGTRSQRLVADFLFSYTLVHRVEATTDVTNIAEQKALERAGFTREGVLRGAQFRRGTHHDMVSYARLRTD